MCSGSQWLTGQVKCSIAYFWKLSYLAEPWITSDQTRLNLTFYSVSRTNRFFSLHSTTFVIHCSINWHVPHKFSSCPAQSPGTSFWMHSTASFPPRWEFPSAASLWCQDPQQPCWDIQEISRMPWIHWGIHPTKCYMSCLLWSTKKLIVHLWSQGIGGNNLRFREKYE